MFKRKKSEYRYLQDCVKTAEEEGISIEELEPEQYNLLESQLTGSFIMTVCIAAALAILHLLEQTGAFRTLLFAAIWKGIDAWGRPYFKLFLTYKLKKLFSGN